MVQALGITMKINTNGDVSKSVTEQIIIKMFSGNAKN